MATKIVTILVKELIFFGNSRHDYAGYSSSWHSAFLALMLSALKSQDIPYTPASVKRILENTATPLGSHDPFSIGHGVIQVYNEWGVCHECNCVCVCVQ